jgi:hypothetical protein
VGQENVRAVRGAARKAARPHASVNGLYLLRGSLFHGARAYEKLGAAGEASARLADATSIS